MAVCGAKTRLAEENRKAAERKRADKSARNELEKRKETRVSRREMEELAEAFTPLVRSLARKYEGRGAEKEDLVQEGYLQLVRIARSVGRRQFLKAVSSRLPGLVRDAASRMRRPDSSVPIDCDNTGDDTEYGCGVDIADEKASEDLDEVEFCCSLAGSISGRELEVALALAGGEKRNDISRRLGISRKAIGKSTAKIASALGKGMKD